MKKRILMLLLFASFGMAGCSTVGGTLVGAGIGSIAGDTELGAAVGFTAGVVNDVFGR